MSLDNFEVGQQLFETLNSRYYRCAISRFYYAAYCAAANFICEPGRNFGHGWNNPPHHDLPGLIQGLI